MADETNTGRAGGIPPFFFAGGVFRPAVRAGYRGEMYTRPRVLILLPLLLLIASTAVSAEDPGGPALFHVRAGRTRLGPILDVGRRLSRTLRRLVAEIESSDVIVHVYGVARSSRYSAGGLQFVQSAGGFRYLRVLVDPRLSPANLIALLAHELQHVAEVARDPAVVDQATFARLYERIGDTGCRAGSAACYETVAARLVGQRVLDEVRRRGM